MTTMIYVRHQHPQISPSVDQDWLSLELGIRRAEDAGLGVGLFVDVYGHDALINRMQAEGIRSKGAAWTWTLDNAKATLRLTRALF